MKNGFFSRLFNALFIILLFSVIVLCLIWFIHTFNIFPLPNKIENLFWSSVEDKENLDEIENSVLELLDDSFYKESGEYEYLTLTPDKATELLKSFKKCDKYFWEVETFSGTSENLRRQLHRIYKSGSKIRVDTVDDFTDSTTVFSDANTFIKNNITGEIKEINGDTEFYYGNVINIAALDYVFANENSKVSYVSVSDSNGEKYLYVEVPKTSFNGLDKYFISLNYGIVFTASSTINDENVFEQKTIKFDSVSLISDETFDISNSKEEA